MKRLLKNGHLPENIEIVVMMILGILLQMADGSPFSLKERWMLVWETELPAENFSAFVQKCIKTLLSMIVVVRCVTTYAYVVSAMLVIFCLLRNTAPKLMLLWLLVAGVKSVCMTFLEAFAGIYVCSAFGKIRKACIEFFISKALEIIFASYLWGNVLNSYQDMERKADINRTVQKKEQWYLQKMDCGPQRARSLVDETTLYKTACLNNFEFKDVPQIILQMLRGGPEMSQDSLLDPGMMIASVSDMGSFDNLKISQSLGELGLTDLRNTQIVGMDEDENLSRPEKALRFLKLTKSEVKRIKLKKSSLENDIYTIDKDIWNGVETTTTLINKPKQARTQVFIRDIPQCEENNMRSKTWKKSVDFHFGFSFSHLFNEKQSEEEEEEDQDEEEEYDEEDSSQIFMSNLTEGAVTYPNRLGIVFKKMKGNAYAELYKKDYMSVIGPEVFDKACKLPRVTSLTTLKKSSEEETQKLLAFNEVPEKKEISSNDSLKEIFQISNEHFSAEQHPEQMQVEIAESSSGEKLKASQEADSTEEERPSLCTGDTKTSNKEEVENKEKFKSQDICSEGSERFATKIIPCHSLSNAETDNCESKHFFRKRRIIIRRIGKRKEKNLFYNSSDSPYSSKNSDPSFANRIKTESDKQDAEICQLSEKLATNTKTSNSSSNWQTDYGGYTKQVYFLTELLQKPLLEVLLTYNDLKKKVHVQKKSKITSRKHKKDFLDKPLHYYSFRRYERILQSFETNSIPEKVWKSRVLRTVEPRYRETSPVTLKSNLNIMRGESVLGKLFLYDRSHLINENTNFTNSLNKALISEGSARGFGCLNSSVENLGSDEIYTSDENISSKPESETSFNPDGSRVKIVETCSVRETKEKFCVNWENAQEKDREELFQKPTTKNSHGIEIPEGKAAKIIPELKINLEAEPQDLGKTDSKVLGNDTEGESLSSQESDEPISLYYSKAANLASPLFDMKRFIYPDHIHYSYKHVKKKGFDVDINGGFPLLIRESLMSGAPVKIGNKSHSKDPEFEITRRPMDLSFASTNAFAEWQSNDQSDMDVGISDKHVQKCSNTSVCNGVQGSSIMCLSKNKKLKKSKRSKNSTDRKDSHLSFRKDSRSKVKPYERSFNNIKYLYSTKDYILIEKLLRMHMQLNNNEIMKTERKPVQISSTQLHSNKGRINSTYNPAIFLQENKTRSERKKKETQEERTKDMFARLEREALLQSKMHKSFGSNRNS